MRMPVLFREDDVAPIEHTAVGIGIRRRIAPGPLLATFDSDTNLIAQLRAELEASKTALAERDRRITELTRKLAFASIELSRRGER